MGTPRSDRRSGGPASAATDLTRRRRDGRIRARGWALRSAVALALVLAVAELQPTATPRIGYGIALAWVPLVGLADAVRARRPRSVRVRAAVLAVDLALLVALLIGAPQAAPAVLWAAVPLVAFHAHLDHARVGLAAAVLAFGLAGYVTLLGALAPVMPATFLFLYALVLVGVFTSHREGGHERRLTARELAAEVERNEALLSGVGEAVVVTGSGGRVQRFNGGAERTLGCDADAALGGRCHEVLGLRAGVTALDCTAGCRLLPGTGEVARDVEVWRTNPATGERQPLLVSALPVRDHTGAPVEVLHSLRDITRVKRAEEAKTMFLATISHELRTPLTVITGFAELLRREPSIDADQHRAAVDAISLRSAELARIVDRLLLSARIESGVVDVALEEVDLRPLLEERVDALSIATGRDVRLDLTAPVPPVRASAAVVTTVIDHLLDNAIKYSPRGGAIEVRVRVDEARVEVDVEDHGVGMTEEQAAACFDRFWQAEPSDTRRFGGTGIGLYIVRSLVDAVEGTITVRSRPDVGTCFTVSLARLSAPAAAPADEAGPVGAGEATMIDEFMRKMGVGRDQPGTPAGSLP